MPVPSLQELLELEKNTPLETVNECLLSGNFEPSPNDPVADGEELIGVLTAFEKAVYTARNRLSQRFNVLLKSLENDTPPNRTLVIRAHKTHEVLDVLLWACIKCRLAEKIQNGVGIGLRTNYQIVLIEDQPPQEDGETSCLGGVIAAEIIILLGDNQSPSGVATH